MSGLSILISSKLGIPFILGKPFIYFIKSLFISSEISLGVLSGTQFRFISDIHLLTAYQEILENPTNYPKFTALFNYFNNTINEAEDETPEAGADSEDESTDSGLTNDFDLPDSAESGDDFDLGKNEETFSNKYPEVNEEETLKKVYEEWIENVRNKPFYKTIESYYASAQAETLNYVDRNFLWKLIKAISSCLTHLFIEGEQKEESLCLVDRYYDSLINCLNSVVHANAKEDVVNSFIYIVDLLGLSNELLNKSEDSSSGGEEDRF